MGMVVDVTDSNRYRPVSKQSENSGNSTWVNNAGFPGPYGPTVMYSRDFYQVIQVNIIGVYNGSRVAMRHFLNQRRGKLINMLGRGAKRPLPYQNAYGSSKVWVRNFTKAMAVETKGSGVGVFTFSPGMVLTDMLTDVEVIKGTEQRLKVFNTILRMWAKPPEAITEKAVWLASSATDGKTGLEISLFSTGEMLRGATKELFRRILKRTPVIDVNIKSSPGELTNIKSPERKQARLQFFDQPTADFFESPGCSGVARPPDPYPLDWKPDPLILQNVEISLRTRSLLQDGQVT
jgi:short-subunit dehydrogenase